MAETESRIKKTLLNARVNLVFYFITLLLSFFSRRVFLDCLGADFVGLTGTLQNLLGFLNLAELGIGGAIGYVLYKPIYDHDHGKINEIISVMGYLYRWIGLVILGGGCVLALFLPLIFPGTQFEMGIIYFAYFSFLASSLIGYFINYRQNLLGADQRNYVVTAYYQTMTLVKTLIQMASAHYTGSYYLWVAIELFFGIVYSFILNWKINQTYPWLKAEVKEGRKLFRKYPEVMVKTRQLFVQNISAFVQYQTTPLLTYAFVSLTTVAYYGNYTLIVDKLVRMMESFMGGVGASVGNLIAEGNKGKIMNVFYEYNTFRFFCAAVIAFILYIVLEPFITLWIGKEYLLSDAVLILVIAKIYIQIVCGNAYSFVYGYGLFSDVWASIAQSLIFIVAALVGGYFCGLSGIIFAAILSFFIIQGLWKTYFLFSRGFKLPVGSYVLYWLGMNGLNLLSVLISLFITDRLIKSGNSSMQDLAICSVEKTLIYCAFTLCLYWFLLKSFRSMVKKLLKIRHK